MHFGATMKKILLLSILLTVLPARARALEDLTFGITPWEDEQALMKMFRPILDHVAKELDVGIEMVVSPDYESLGKMLNSGKVQVGQFSPSVYVMAKDTDPGIEYILTCNKRIGNRTVDSYYGYILVMADSPYRNIIDLKGKRFAFTNTQSASGYIYPLMLLKGGYMIPDLSIFFKEILFLETHPRVTEALMENKIDAGATWEANYETATKKYGQVFRIIARTKHIPYDAIAVRGFGDEERTRIQKAFLEVPPAVIEAAQAKGFPYAGWSIKDDSLYDVARKVNQFSVYEEKRTTCFIDAALP